MFNGTITGHLGRDPELKYLENGSVVANFTVAVRQAKRNGQDQPARWVKVAVWGKSAQYVGDYVRKGDGVMCIGRVEAPELFTRRDGSQGLAEVFTAENIEKWSERQQGESPAPAAAPAAQATHVAPNPAPAPAPAQHPALQAAGWSPNPANGTVAAGWNSAPLASPDGDDDIPF